MTNIRKRDSAAMLQSLGSGVVPRTGLEHIVVGRSAEIKQVLQELELVKDGASVVKFIVGPFGSGKSFMLSLIRQVALSQKFVVAETDFSPERRLYGDEKGVATYAALVNSLATTSRPDGQALQAILERWISQVQTDVANRGGLEGIPFDDPSFVRQVQAEIRSVLSHVDELTGGFDFAEAINAYYRGYAQENQELMRNALRWLRGEYRLRSDAKRDLGVRGVIDDDNWYDHLKVLARFVTQIGYEGLVVLLDEAINLYKITHPQNRAKNYEMILNLFNDAQQGRIRGLYVLIGSTPEFVHDERRGLASYEALKSRLQTNPYETAEFRDLAQPVVTLPMLRNEELLTLLQKLRDIHAAHFDYLSLVTDADIEGFLSRLLSRPGAEHFLTIRDVVRSFLNALNLLEQNPSMVASSIFESAVQKAETDSRATHLLLAGEEPLETEPPSPSPLDRFQVKR